jgi:hypothetical protein
MDFNATIDLIIKDLDDTRHIIDDLKKYPGVPLLQIELAKAKCKSAGEVISLLKSERYKIPEVRETVENNPPREEQKEESPVDKSTLSPVIVEEEIKKIEKKVSESSIIADKFSHMSNRINEQLGGLKGDDDVSDILKSKQLSNLSEAIGLNDKFLFIREIFNGNKEAYTQAISRLDSVANLKDARAVIMSYTGDGKENEATKLLLDLVKRKFPSNE